MIGRDDLLDQSYTLYLVQWFLESSRIVYLYLGISAFLVSAAVPTRSRTRTGIPSTTCQSRTAALTPRTLQKTNQATCEMYVCIYYNIKVNVKKDYLTK